MNYRHDSDIVELYGFRIRNRNVPLSKKDYTLRKLPNGLNVNWNMKRGNPIFWVASHCPTDNFREDYVQELKKHIGIDLYMHDLFEKKVSNLNSRFFRFEACRKVYRPGQPNWENTMWKLQDFSATRFYMKSILVILKPPKLPFSPFE